MKAIITNGVLLIIGSAATTLTQRNPAQSSLTVNVSDFRNCVEMPITGPTTQYMFDHLPAVSYAVGVIHDENGNHKLDYDFFGIPKEAYGISNDARGGSGRPPTFDQAKVTVPPDGSTITIKIK